MCYSLNISDDQLAALAVREMLPALREKLAGNKFENLIQVAQKVSGFSNQFQSVQRDTRFQKNAATVGFYDDDLDDITDDEEIAAAEWNWCKKTVVVPNIWGKEESYNFDITKVDKIFDFLLEKAQIKLPLNHVKPSPAELKNKRYCKYHGADCHNTNDCRAFRHHIQKAVMQGKLKFDLA
jgi:hypothetical protein